MLFSDSFTYCSRVPSRITNLIIAQPACRAQVCTCCSAKLTNPSRTKTRLQQDIQGWRRVFRDPEFPTRPCLAASGAGQNSLIKSAPTVTGFVTVCLWPVLYTALFRIQTDPDRLLSNNTKVGLDSISLHARLCGIWCYNRYQTIEKKNRVCLKYRVSYELETSLNVKPTRWPKIWNRVCHEIYVGWVFVLWSQKP